MYLWIQLSELRSKSAPSVFNCPQHMLSLQDSNEDCGSVTELGSCAQIFQYLKVQGA